MRRTLRDSLVKRYHKAFDDGTHLTSLNNDELAGFYLWSFNEDALKEFRNAPIGLTSEDPRIQSISALIKQALSPATLPKRAEDF